MRRSPLGPTTTLRGSPLRTPRRGKRDRFAKVELEDGSMEGRLMELLGNVGEYPAELQACTPAPLRDQAVPLPVVELARLQLGWVLAVPLALR